MQRVLSITVAVLIAAFASALSHPAMASTTASCNSVSLYTDNRGALTDLPTIGYDTHRDNCLMGVGNQSVAVQYLQDNLDLCYNRNIADDGIFGPQTRAALQYAQRVERIPDDGVYGPQTRDHLHWWDPDNKCTRVSHR